MMLLSPRVFCCLALCVFSSLASASPVFAALDGTSDHDRFILRFSTETEVRALSICEQNVVWKCGGGDGRYRQLAEDSGPGDRRYFKSRESILLWDGKKLYLRLRYRSGESAEQVLQIAQKKQVFGGELTNPYVGDAQPRENLLFKPCVFAMAVPDPDYNGERGSTYAGHRTSRDYWTDDRTPLYAMGTCETVKRIDTGTEHPCGFGIAMRCRLAGEIMGVLYCHLSEPARKKKFFGIGEAVGYSGHSGTDNPHLHLGLTFDVYDHSLPRPPGLQDEELLMPGLPVPENNPDKWLRENDCYHPPTGEQRPGSPSVRPRNSSRPRPIWDGLEFQGDEVWDLKSEQPTKT